MGSLSFNELDSFNASDTQRKLSPVYLENIFNGPLEKVKGKFKLVRFHNQILEDIKLNKMGKDILSKMFIYQILLKNTTFSKEGSSEIFPRWGLSNLFELVMIEHLVSSQESAEIFGVFWTDLNDKIKYFLNFFEFVKGDQNTNIQYLDNYILALRNLKSVDPQDSLFERETLRLQVINGFLLSTPDFSLLHSKPVPIRPLHSLLFKGILKETIEKLMGLNFERFLREEHTNQTIPGSQTHENLEKEVGNSALSKSFLGDESILGSIMNIDFNLSSKKPLGPSRWSTQ
jgi:hypothetical protein